jgi:hypothetical protein
MQQLSMSINNLPLSLVLVSNGTLGIVPKGAFPTIFDSPEQGIHAIITPEKMVVGNTSVLYNTSLKYKEMPELLEWLVQQDLEKPY